MVRRRFAADRQAAESSVGNSRAAAGYDDRNQRDSIKGYKKIAVIIFLFIVALMFRIYVLDVVAVAGDSMKDSFLNGDVLLVRPQASGIERYDVVVAKVEGQRIIKRVIALPGESIQIVGGEVLVDGEKLAGEYAFFTERSGLANEPFILGDDEYFLMGDNRSGSFDSRDFGPVKGDELSGRVVCKLFAFR